MITYIILLAYSSGKNENFICIHMTYMNRGIKMKNENNNMGNCIECGKSIYCGSVKEPLCQECTMVINFKTLVKFLRGNEE